jgi:hypothetical protein
MKKQRTLISKDVEQLILNDPSVPLMSSDQLTAYRRELTLQKSVEMDIIENGAKEGTARPVKLKQLG